VRSSRFEINRGDPTEVQTWEDITNNISEAQSSTTKNMTVQFRKSAQAKTPAPLENEDTECERQTKPDPVSSSADPSPKNSLLRSAIGAKFETIRKATKDGVV
jgi:hypothetical protein